MDEKKHSKDVHTSDSEEQALENLINKLHDSKFLDDDDYQTDLEQIKHKKD